MNQLVPTHPPTMSQIEDAEAFVEGIRQRRLHAVLERKAMKDERSKLKQEAAIDKWDRLIDRLNKKIEKLDEGLGQAAEIVMKMRGVLIEYEELDQ